MVAAAGHDRATSALSVLGPLPWSPETPRLYRITATLRRAGELLDALSETFGFRTVEARDGRIYLNGEPVYLRGALDQDYYPDGICTTPSEAFLEDQFRKAKALGLNCVRCHIKVPDPRYYAVADRVGLLVWTELPNVGRLTDGAAERLRDHAWRASSSATATTPASSAGRSSTRTGARTWSTTPSTAPG